MIYSFRTLDEVSSCDGLKVRWLSPGVFVSTLESVLLDDVRLYRGSVSQHALLYIPTPPGFCTIITPISVQSSVQYCGEALNDARFGLGYKEVESCILLRGSGGVILCQAPVSVLENPFPESGRVLEASHGAKFIDALNVIFNQCRMPAGFPIRKDGCREANSEVLARVSELLTHGRPHGASRSQANCQQLLERASEVAHCQSGPMSLQDFARATGAGPRTLQRIFRNTLGYSPLKYLRWRRLCGFRRDLLATPQRTATVTEIASRWGFTEMGRVAGEYRQLFGESPVVTLRTFGNSSKTGDTCAL